MRLWDRRGGRSVPETGRRVRIGIFDTSPFTDTVVTGQEQTLEELMQVSGLEQFRADMRLTVWHPELIAAPTCPGWDRHLTNTHSLEDQDISNHGLFVAGLAHVVAPESEIHLIRVLEDDGCGGLYSIAKSILEWQESAPQGADVTDTVINLSLGVHRPPCPGGFGLPLWCPRDLTTKPADKGTEPADEGAGPSGAVCLLKRVEALVQDRGAVVVAAAGNDSYQDVGVALLAEMPAGHPDVIGVAASTRDGERACFSNRGDVAAPGGDGEGTCVVPNCAGDHDPRCLISLVNESQPGYRYWVGTSFATPLVSGLSALVVQELREAGEIGNLTAVVRARLTGSAVLLTPPVPSVGLGAGIVDVQSVLGP
jgi:hypothetical protein